MNRIGKAWLIAAIFGAALHGGVSAADVYTLDPVTVTAQREAMADLKTPAAVTVLTHEQLEQTGATGMQEALKFSTGLIIHAQGPRNISQGTMTNKVVIRGVEKGTLVLVDGVPINQGGRYNLEDISVESVERVEIVRGGGAVLYGSEAAGGVINIITKGERENMVKAGAGNYGIQNYAASMQAGKFGATVSYDHTGKIDDISSPETGRPVGMYYNIIRGEHTNVNWRYNLSDNLFFTHTYGQNSDHYVYRWDGRNGLNPGADSKDVLHSTVENLAMLNYAKDDLKAQIFYNRRDQKTKNYTAVVKPNRPGYDPSKNTYDDSGYLDQSFGFDTSNRWHLGEDSFLLGVNFQRDLEEKRMSDPAPSKNERPVVNYSRNMYSLYGQYDHRFTDKTSANLNFRETWTGEDGAGNKYDKFTPELVLMHELDENTSLYAKAGKSFMMPTFSQLYGGGDIIGNPLLKPQSGKHYELGWKRNVNNQSFRLALFHYAIDDSIESALQIDKDTGDMIVNYTNEDIRNTGIEFDYTKQASEDLTWNAGLSYSHPEKQSTNDKGIKGDWHDYYGRLQLNAGVSWTRGKLTTAAHVNYLGKRVRDTDDAPSLKAQLFTDLNFSYAPNKESRFFLNIDNVLDRKDIISTSTSTFYSLGRNFMAGYEYKF